MSHGAEGELTLGSTTLTDGDHPAHADALADIGAALAPGGDLMLYVFDVGSGEAGQQFVQDLSEYLGGAHVAASTDLTGSPANGGDWRLERSTGPIEASNRFVATELASYSGVLTNETFTVNQTTTLLTDNDFGGPDGVVDPGDVVRTIVTITNNSTTPTPVDASRISFTETLNGMTLVNQAGNDVNVSPIALNETYTLLEVGNATSQTGPQSTVAGHVTDNDIEFFSDVHDQRRQRHPVAGCYQRESRPELACQGCR